MVTYDGDYWVVDFDRPNANDLYGTLGSGKISYDNATSGLTSTNVKEAIDEVASKVDAAASETEVQSHITNTGIHVTAEEKIAWNEKATTTYVTEQIEAAIGSALGGSY